MMFFATRCNRLVAAASTVGAAALPMAREAQEWVAVVHPKVVCFQENAADDNKTLLATSAKNAVETPLSMHSSDVTSEELVGEGGKAPEDSAFARMMKWFTPRFREDHDDVDNSCGRASGPRGQPVLYVVDPRTHDLCSYVLSPRHYTWEPTLKKLVGHYKAYELFEDVVKRVWINNEGQECHQWYGKGIRTHPLPVEYPILYYRQDEAGTVEIVCSKEQHGQDAAGGATSAVMSLVLEPYHGNPPEHTGASYLEVGRFRIYPSMEFARDLHSNKPFRVTIQEGSPVLEAQDKENRFVGTRFAMKRRLGAGQIAREYLVLDRTTMEPFLLSLQSDEATDSWVEPKATIVRLPRSWGAVRFFNVTQEGKEEFVVLHEGKWYSVTFRPHADGESTASKGADEKDERGTGLGFYRFVGARADNEEKAVNVLNDKMFIATFTPM